MIRIKTGLAATGSALVLALAACSESPEMSGGDMSKVGNAAYAPMPAAPQMEYAVEESRDAYSAIDLDKQIVQPGPDGGGGAPPGMAPLMAYSYAWNFSVPSANMEGLQNAHKKLCEEAGPSNCYVTNSNLSAIGEEEGASGNLSMRATEAWVRKFEGGVNDGLKPFGGSVYGTNRGAEELTAQIVDNEARLKSMTAHRDALQKMLEDRPGKLSDLLEIRQALAQAQGDIDSRQSLLAALKLRVSMSVLNFSYQAEYAAASRSMWRPVTDAFADFGPAFARTIGGIVRFIAALLPIIVLGALGIAAILGGYRWWGRRRGRKADRLAAAEKSTSGAKP
jgi:hypothetical protein